MLNFVLWKTTICSSSCCLVINGCKAPLQDQNWRERRYIFCFVAGVEIMKSSRTHDFLMGAPCSLASLKGIIFRNLISGQGSFSDFLAAPPRIFVDQVPFPPSPSRVGASGFMRRFWYDTSSLPGSLFCFWYIECQGDVTAVAHIYLPCAWMKTAIRYVRNDIMN